MTEMPTQLHRHGHHRAAERIRHIHSAVVARGSSVVLVTAPDGGGKSHLVDTVLTGTTGVTAVLTRALPWEQEVPWVTADRILQRLPRPSTGTAPARGQTTSADLNVEGDMEADMEADGDAAGETAGEDPGTASTGRSTAQVVQALATAIGSAGPGTIIVIDDADHADQDSLRALGSALESSVDGSVLLILTARSPSTGQSADLCAVLSRETLRLGALDHSEIRALAAARTGREPSAAAARRIQDYTGGDTGAVTAVVDEAADSWWVSPFSPPPLPASVELETAALLSQLDPGNRSIIETAAVLPSPVLLESLATLAAIREQTAGVDGRVLAALDAAHRAGILRVDLSPGAASLAFRSPLVRTAVLRGIPPRELISLHTAAARLAREQDPDAALDHLASTSTGPDPELCRTLRDRALEHARSGHWSAAGHAYLTAAALTPDPEEARGLHIDGIDALLGAGRISEAAALSHALDRVRPDPRRDAVLGSLAMHLGHASEAEALLRRALESSAPADSGAPAPDPVALAQKFVVHSLCGWRPDRLRYWAGKVISSAQPDQPEVEEARAVTLLGQAIDAEAGSGAADEDRLGALAPAVAQRFEMSSGWIALAHDDLETARRRLGSAVPTADVSGSARISLWSQAWLARTHLLRGDWDDALRVVDTAARRLDDLELDLLAPVIHWSGAVIRSMRGDHIGAAAHMRHFTTSGDAYPVQIIPSAMARMQVAAAAADHTSVRRAAEPLHALSLRVDIDQPGFWPWHDLYAHALVLAGRLEDTEALIGPPEARALELGHRSTLARLGAVRSRIAAVRGDIDECTRIFHRSLEYLDGLAMPYYSAQLHFAFGQTLRRAGRRREAHLALGTARDLYEQLGARAYVERCDRERRAGGVDVARSVGNSTLTPQERAVATLVAAGRTNAQSAEELFLSVKTVQYHLTRIYSKLGISGRTELAAHVARSSRPFGPEPGDQGVP